MAKSKVKFPEVLFVTINKFSDGSGEWKQAHDNEIAAVEDEDKASDVVATYQLVKTRRLGLVKTVKVVEK